MADDWGAFPTLAAPAENGVDWSAFPAAPAQPTAPMAPQPVSAGQAFWHGMWDPIIGGAQIGARMLAQPGGGIPEQAGAPPGPDLTDQVDALTKQREGDYQAQREAARQNGIDWWRLAGNTLAPTNFAFPTIPGAGMATGALGGALTAAMQPVADTDNFAADKAAQVGLGGTLGGILGPLGNMIRGARSPDVRLLEDAGVTLTPGQAGGAVAKTSEALASKLPVVRNIAAAHQENAIGSFNRGVYNQILEPLGEKLPDNLSAGHDAFDAAAQKVSGFYHDILPGLHYDPEFNNGAVTDDILNIRNGLPLSQRAEFDRVTEPLLEPHSGEALKKVDSDLAGYAAPRRKAIGNPDAQSLGSAVDDARDLLRNQLALTNPDAASKLDLADRAFATLKVAERAGGMKADAEGVFTPRQILQASKQGPYGASNNQFMRGGALLQPFAEAGQRVIGSGRGAGRAPATAADLLTTDILGTAIGLGGAGLGAGGQQGYLPDWAKYGMAAAPLLALTRPGTAALGLLGPGRAVRGLLGTGATVGPASASAGLLGSYQ